MPNPIVSYQSIVYDEVHGEPSTMLVTTANSMGSLQSSYSPRSRQETEEFGRLLLGVALELLGTDVAREELRALDVISWGEATR